MVPPFPFPEIEIVIGPVRRVAYKPCTGRGRGIAREISAVRQKIKLFERKYKKVAIGKRNKEKILARGTFVAMTTHPGRAWCTYCGGGNLRTGTPGYKADGISRLKDHFTTNAHRTNYKRALA